MLSFFGNKTIGIFLVTSAQCHFNQSEDPEICVFAWKIAGSWLVHCSVQSVAKRWLNGKVHFFAQSTSIHESASTSGFWYVSVLILRCLSRECQEVTLEVSPSHGEIFLSSNCKIITWLSRTPLFVANALSSAKIHVPTNGTCCRSRLLLGYMQLNAGDNKTRGKVCRTCNLLAA